MTDAPETYRSYNQWQQIREANERVDRETQEALADMATSLMEGASMLQGIEIAEAVEAIRA